MPGCPVALTFRERCYHSTVLNLELEAPSLIVELH